MPILCQLAKKLPELSLSILRKTFSVLIVIVLYIYLDSAPPYPVIIFSAHFNPNDTDQPGDCDGIIYKPFDLEQLVKIVHLHLNLKVTYDLL